MVDKKLFTKDYLKKKYNIDINDFKIGYLDYSEVKTVQDLIEWAFKVFDLPEKIELIEDNNADKMIVYLFQILGDREQDWVILEKYRRHISNDLEYVLEGLRIYSWKQVLGFHLPRDYRVSVNFIPDPVSRYKRPPKI